MSKTILLLVTLGTSLLADTVFDFNTLPVSGTITGAPSQTVGWGYTISNSDPTLWLVLAGITSDPFANGLPSFVFDFPIIAPLTQVSEPFDGVNGLLGVNIFGDATIGASDTGTFTLSAQWFTGDPFAGGVFLQDASDQSARYSLVVSSVPEPGTIFLVLPVIIFCILPSRFAVPFRTRLRTERL